MNSIEDEELWLTRWPAPPKLNLMLKIVGRREDGYHLLQTVFQFLEGCSDWLIFSPRSDGNISLAQPLPDVPEAQDLTIRAARLLQSESNCLQGVQIEVEKNLPMGGGLGGGSSDAATTLVALNRLWALGLSVQDLMQLGLQLGADVPVFIQGHSVWAEGVGEIFTPIEPPEPWYVVVVPGCHVATQDVFSAPMLTRDSKLSTIADFFSGAAGNDCLSVVFDLYPQVKAAHEALSVYSSAHLTGTGACVFAPFEVESKAREAAVQLSLDWQVFVAKGANRSALMGCFD